MTQILATDDAGWEHLRIDRPRQPFVYAGRLAEQFLGPGELQEIADDALASVNVAVDALERPREPVFLASSKLTDHFHGDTDRAQGIAQLVADRGRDLAKCCEALVSQDNLPGCVEVLGHLTKATDEFADLVLPLEAGKLAGRVAAGELAHHRGQGRYRLDEVARREPAQGERT